MAFVLTRPSSPALSRESHPTMDTSSSSHTHQTPGHSNLDTDMGKDKDKTKLEILLDTPCINLKGLGVDVEPVRLSGHVSLYLTESTSIKEITLQFRGKARLPVPPSDTITISGSPLTYIVCTHGWSFLEGDRKGRSHTLKAGHHLFPFQLQIGGSLPSSISTGAFGGASVVYKLRAEAVRTGLNQNLHAATIIPVMRSFSAEALEYQQTLEIENTWPDKLMYSIMVPHKAWAIGDKVTALVKFSPLAKGVCILNVTTSIYEQTKVYARMGAQESTRLVTSVKHEIVGSRAVEVELHPRPGHHHTPSHPSSPASPVTPASRSEQPQSHHGHRPNSISNPSWLHLVRTDHASSSDPTTEPEESTSNDTTDESAESENSDVVTYLSMMLPSTLTPTHGLQPIIVTHRIRWNILILNLDGHTSELRCSLPLHILDPWLLGEARAFSAATRRLLLGGPEGPPAEEEEDVQLPSYKAHVRDRVANMFLPESATMRVTNPWISQGASPTYHPDHPPTQWPMSRSGHSTPLEAHLLSHLPHAPGSGTSTPLDWVNSELLLSLSEDQPPRLSPNSRTPSSEAHSDSEPPSQNRSRQGSSRASRATSVERGSDRPSIINATKLPVGGPHETYVHSSNASRQLHGLFSTSMKPFSHFSPNHWIHRAHHAHSPLSTSEVAPPHVSSQEPHTVGVPVAATDPSSGSALLHRAFTEVPDYTIASRGFIGGVPPLSSMRGLPSYEETQRAADPEAGAGTPQPTRPAPMTRATTAPAMPTSQPSPNSSQL